MYGKLLTKFFEINDYPDLAWMHHLACKRYGAAAITLSTVNKRASNLSEKHVSCIIPFSAIKLTSSSSAVSASLPPWRRSNRKAIRVV